MDALSALKMVGAPNLTGPLAGLTPGSGAAAGFSAADLQQLGNLLPGGLTSTATTGVTPADLPQAFPEIDLTAPGAATPTGDSASFQNMLGGLVQEVSDKQAAANSAVTGLLSGKSVSLHQAMISVEEASVSLQLMVEVRNRLLDSYQELMRMQV